MSDEQGTPITGDSPATDAAQDTNWEQRFKDTQAAYTQSQQALKEAQSAWDDEDAVLARIAEKHPHLIAEDEPEEETDDDGFVPADQDIPPHDPRLDQILPVIDTFQADLADRAYQKDLQGFVGERELPEKGQQFVRALCAQLGDNAKALETAVNEWFALFPEEKKERPKAPHTPGKGGAVTGGKPWSELTPEERLERQLDRAAELESQT